jgi:hypothetical protein
MKNIQIRSLFLLSLLLSQFAFSQSVEWSCSGAWGSRGWDFSIDGQSGVVQFTDRDFNETKKMTLPNASKICEYIGTLLTKVQLKDSNTEYRDVPIYTISYRSADRYIDKEVVPLSIVGPAQIGNMNNLSVKALADMDEEVRQGIDRVILTNLQMELMKLFQALGVAPSPGESLIGDPDWGVRMTRPQQWKTWNSNATGVQWWNKDHSLWFSAITSFARLPADWQREWLPKHCEAFGVNTTVSEERPRMSERRVGTFKATEYHIAATWKEAPAEIRIITVELSPNRIFVMTVGCRSADCLLHNEFIEETIDSIRFKADKKADSKTGETKDEAVPPNGP